jgi:hypothetical protein
MPTFELVRAGGVQHIADWQRLRAQRSVIAAAHSPSAAFKGLGDLDLWCRVLGPDASLVTGAVVSVTRSRKLPILCIGRVHFSTPLLSALGSDGMRELVAALRRLPNGPSVLSVHVYAVHDHTRALAEQILFEAGFELESEPRTFHRTLLIPVAGSERDWLAQLSYGARRGIRQVGERGFHVAKIQDAADADRVAWLNAEAHRRTGSRGQYIDFATLINAARNDSESTVLLGMYHPDRPPKTALVGFAHGYTTGQGVVYASAGTERAADIGSTPLSYGLVAQLLEWTASVGCDVFDFGGITPADEPDHPLSGISEFKRKFRGTEAQVASDFCVAVKPMGARMLSALGAPARLLRGR